jgi:hypothetical protein
MPRYGDYVPSDLTSKSNTLYSFFARSTIPWLLTCESQGKSRDSVLAVVSGQIEGTAGGLNNLSAIVAGGFLILFLSAFFIGPMICAGARRDYLGSSRKAINCYLTMGVLMGLIQISFGVMIVVHNIYAASFFNISEEKVNSMAYVNGCSDNFTKIDALMY